MSEHRNGFGQPIGFPVPGWTARPRPPATPMTGRYCRVEPVDIERHAAELFEANAEDDGRNWTYLPAERPADPAAYKTWLSGMAAGNDPMFHAIVETAGGRAVGIASYLRIDPGVGSIEVGHINYAPRLQRTAAATEAMFLMMARAFDELGYRRYEWKCDSLNAPSRAAAARYGFRYEGIFVQATIYKARNRDTAWYSITDKEWPTVKSAFERWLDPANFDAAGKQRLSLSELTRAAAR